MDKLELAKNPNTPPEVLEKLATDEYVYVRLNVAKKYGDSLIRYYVAFNPSTPPKVLEKLATDEDCAVRRAVAQNFNTPPKALEKLANDEDVYVRRRVAENPNTPKYIKTYSRYKNYLKCYEQI